ncbi:fructosamine kinase family protein [Salsuginibacillus kocurii]|uniref:fructosamine kinase family protein n=1 Tax=Salsuginibacillus kocurii TaxID=427078 RepID=UPI0003673C02|nr:fructosamine kinase family protein [Salsuginibacillus kocurii]
MKNIVDPILDKAGISSSLQHIEAVSGGSINDTYYVETTAGRYLLKVNHQAPMHFFEQEARGLTFIGQTNSVGVPRIYARGDKFLLLEWIEREPQPDSYERLGHGLAAMHQATSTYDEFGLASDNFIGELPQPNGYSTNWVEFYREARLYPQFELARSAGRLPQQRAKLAWSLLDRLEEWLPQDPVPARLHGDMWSGNWVTGPQGKPYVIDPAVYVGHAEVDVAFMELFGGFPDEVFHAYYELQPLDPEFKHRKSLYQLYYLLVHLNTFGESYGPSVDRILEHYSLKQAK